MTTCSTCRWFDADFVPVDSVDDPADARGLCGYPRNRLPLSEQGVPSERRPVGPHETDCPRHEIRDDEAGRRAEIIARALFPDDYADGSDCRAEVGREGEPCWPCAGKNAEWARIVERVREAVKLGSF